MNITINQVDPTHSYHQTTAEYTFFSNAHGTFPRVDHMLGLKLVSIHFKGLKSDRVCSLSITELNLKLIIRYFKYPKISGN